MTIVKLRTNRQLTIPVSICEAADLQIGDFLEVQYDGEIISLQPKKVVDKNQSQSKVIPNDNKKGLSKIIGMVKKGGHPDDYSVNHDKYLADAYANESTENLRERP